METPEIEQEDEPVYQIDATRGYWKDINEAQYLAWPKDKMRKLNTHPPTDNLRKAAKEFVDAYDKRDPIIGAFIENLRTALEKK